MFIMQGINECGSWWVISDRAQTELGAALHHVTAEETGRSTLITEPGLYPRASVDPAQTNILGGTAEQLDNDKKKRST